MKMESVKLYVTDNSGQTPYELDDKGTQLWAAGWGNKALVGPQLVRFKFDDE